MSTRRLRLVATNNTQPSRRWPAGTVNTDSLAAPVSVRAVLAGVDLPSGGPGPAVVTLLIDPCDAPHLTGAGAVVLMQRAVRGG
ncbi:hypothetical protein GCM10010124_40070 [Pilimelia terevasa]|uniref:Uncharacterized protein n=1 Tax=Pilimelia terevasa TaxID=53372 RepID=A0A8J3FM37_9ACTN|nr:hypothetical protein [Pilimelia terevasa]GGK43287.1 hypothetical protein GCM10010124_40070 [Pilimelia terevasa]